jgi:hypothetical protein
MIGSASAFYFSHKTPQDVPGQFCISSQLEKLLWASLDSMITIPLCMSSTAGSMGCDTLHYGTTRRVLSSSVDYSQSFGRASIVRFAIACSKNSFEESSLVVELVQVSSHLQQSRAHHETLLMMWRTLHELYSISHCRIGRIGIHRPT